MPSATTPSALCVAWLVLCSPYFVSGAGGGDTTRVDDDDMGRVAGVVSVGVGGGAGTGVGIGGVGGVAGRRRPPASEATAGSSTLHAMPTGYKRKLGEASEAARSVCAVHARDRGDKEWRPKVSDKAFGSRVFAVKNACFKVTRGPAAPQPADETSYAHFRTSTPHPTPPRPLTARRTLG